MQPSFDHNKLLTKIANNKLKPHGIFQKGKSRTFFYDNGWYTIVIEFQPSSWSKGTYLNVGVDFNFYPRDYFAFGHGYREKGFEEAENETQFADIIGKYCDIAIERVKKLNREFEDIATAIKTYAKDTTDDSWRYFDLGIMYGLAGRFREAKMILTKLKNRKCEFDYEFERNKLTAEVLTWIEDEANFDVNVKSLIEKTRQLKKLPDRGISFLTIKATKPKNLFTFWKSR